MSQTPKLPSLAQALSYARDPEEPLPPIDRRRSFMFSPASPSSSFDFKPSPSRDFFPRDFPSPPSSASPQDYSFPARSKPPFDSAPSFVGSPYDPTTSRPPSSPSSFALQAPPEGTFGARSRFSPSFPMSGPSFSGLPAMDVPPNSPDRPAYPQSAYSLPATPVSPAYSSGSTFSGTSSSTSSGLKITKSRPTFSREQIREMENLLATAIYPSADEVAAASQRTGMTEKQIKTWLSNRRAGRSGRELPKPSNLQRFSEEPRSYF